MRTRASTKDARVTLFEPDHKSELSEETPPPPPKRSPSGETSKKRAAPATDHSSLKKSPKKIKAAHTTPLKPPPRWKEALDLIKEQRKTLIAPVDTMGCDEAGKLEDEQDRPDSDARTKDPVTHEAMMNLRRNLPGGLTLESLRGATEEQIQQCICKVGFWRRKTEYLKKAAEILANGDGDVPKTIEGLLELPGVGPKMGFLALQSCWNLNVGIGVDTHVHRITNRLRWHKKETTDPEATRINLESWLPKELHRTINHTLVGFGQTICLPVAPRCDLCSLSKVSGLCPSKRHVKASPAKKSPFKSEQVEDAKIKVEVEPAIVDGQLVQGVVVKTEEDGLVEQREVKQEHDGHIDKNTSLVW